MRRLDDLINTLKDIDHDKICKELEVAFSSEKIKVIQLNRERLYTYGKDREGNSLGEYSPFTMYLKERKGQPTDRVTLRDTGDFYSSIDIRFLADGFEIVSTDEKYELLKARWGDKILGLTDDDVEELKEEVVRPALDSFLNKISNAF